MTMQSRTYYNQFTGQIITSVSGDLSMLDLSAYEDHPYIVGVGNAQSQYVENGQFVSIPEQPSQDSVFDYEFKSWVACDDGTKKQFVLYQREKLLSKTDWTQLPDVPSEKKALWAEYRQKLRDITAQDGYPFAIIWPTEPR